jgi:hypothetical protein
LPPANAPPPDLLTTPITATAVGRGNARVTRVVIVRFGAMLLRGYDVLYWGRVSSDGPPVVAVAASIMAREQLCSR